MKQKTVKTRSFRDIFCSTCGYSGHNKRTCTYVKLKKKRNSKFHYDLDKLKFIITSGLRNKSIDFLLLKAR